ncbi:MAG: hypothetical protein HN348_16205 [Proteobacteria bacterium]|nr:hypothetical protein [Pseudomonadota bacterium]
MSWNDVVIHQINKHTVAIGKHTLVQRKVDLRWLCGQLKQIQNNAECPGDSDDIPRELREVVSTAPGGDVSTVLDQN